MSLHSVNMTFQNVFASGRNIRQKSALRGRILFASTKVMHRPSSDTPLHFDIRNTYQTRTES